MSLITNTAKKKFINDIVNSYELNINLFQISLELYNSLTINTLKAIGSDYIGTTLSSYNRLTIKTKELTPGDIEDVLLRVITTDADPGIEPDYKILNINYKSALGNENSYLSNKPMFDKLLLSIKLTNSMKTFITTNNVNLLIITAKSLSVSEEIPIFIEKLSPDFNLYVNDGYLNIIINF